MAMSKGMTGKIGPASVKQDITLGDYIARIDSDRSFPGKKKLTFEEWLRQSSFLEPDAGTFIWLQDCWKAAQENV